MTEVTTESTIREFRQIVSSALGRDISRSTLYYWLSDVCYWVGVKDFYTHKDLEWIVYWENFRTRRSRSKELFHIHVKQKFGGQNKA